MSHDIAFLHTAYVHVGTFERLMADAARELRVRHDVRPELPASAQAERMTPQLESSIAAAVREGACTGAPVVVCTCSTIGAISEGAGGTEGEPFAAMRIDRAMADAAARDG